MILTLWTSKKSMHVTETEISLSAQGDEGSEQYGSSLFSRTIVRAALNINAGIARVIPQRVRDAISRRFEYEDVEHSGAPYDMIRATVNLTTSSLLIAMATSLKLPLSTTYVCFMVAMGTSLADRAWGRESAVFRITGVLSVIGGWFITARVAFTVCFFVALAMYYGGAVVMAAMIVLAVALLIHSNIRYRRKLKSEHEDNLFRQILAEKDKNRVWELLRTHVSGTFAGMLAYTADNSTMADVKMQSYSYKDYIYVWNPDTQTGDNQVVTRYDIEPVLEFADGSKIAIEEYVETGFDSLTKTFEDLADAYMDLIDGK